MLGVLRPVILSADPPGSWHQIRRKRRGDASDAMDL